MKKVWFLVLLLLSSIFLTGCFKQGDNPQVSFDFAKSWTIANNENIVPWWYLYKNLDLSKEAEREEYAQLQSNKNQILAYQTKTSFAVNTFINTIYEDLLESCKVYWTGDKSNTGSYYERDVCVDNYISRLYQKLKTALTNPQKKYSWKDPILLSYYQDLEGDHPFVRYFVDLYSYILKRWWDLWSIPPWPNGPIQSEDKDFWENVDKKMYKNNFWFYTFWKKNLRNTSEGQGIESIGAGIVVNGRMLEWIKKDYWYDFPYWPLEINSGTAPMYWPFVLYYHNEYNHYIYQIIGSWWGSGEFYLLVWKLSRAWLRIPIGECWYTLFSQNPQLFGECKEWKNKDPLTIFTREGNLYEDNTIQRMADNFTFFLSALESTRVLSK